MGKPKDDSYQVDKSHTPGKGNPEWLHTELQDIEQKRSRQEDYDRRTKGRTYGR